MLQNKIIPLIFLIISLIGCEQPKEKDVLNTPNSQKTEPTLFDLLSPESTNIHFQNTLKEGLNANVLVYEYLYNGGGVAVGDFNGDNLEDIYFTSNMGENKFYINLGDFKFKEVSQLSKVQGREGPWKTGVSVADVNGDGKLDLYLCYSGALPEEKRRNQLFINQGNNVENIPVFKEEAQKYGLDSPAYSNQGYFFDYDKDGDLDMLLLNHSPKSLPVLNEVLTKDILKKDDPLQGLRVYKQENGSFKDVTNTSGVNGSGLSYGLGIGISDINNDGLLDFYVSNDYAIPDYLYINNGDGTFKDQLKSQLGHTSHFSMGNSIADINNDGLQDIYTLDMLPEDNKRQKLLLSPDNYEKFDLNIRSGFHYQYMRNMLHLNNGNNSFSEIGQLSGISNTDWSWAPLFADFDNDGLKDLFVTNGYFRDYTNLDYINYMQDYVQSKGRLLRQDVLDLIAKMPSSDLTNYYFSNKDGFTFNNNTIMAGVNQPSNSNGASYADLDNDGDLDLIVNNINKTAFIYRNNSTEINKNYLKVKLEGDGKNTQGIGSKVHVYSNGKLQVIEQIPNRGYLSAVSQVLHFGMGQKEIIDSLTIHWNSGNVETLKNIKCNTTVVLKESTSKKIKKTGALKKTLFQKTKNSIAHADQASTINDFKRQPLLPKQLSHKSPAMAVGDFNKDGMDDLIIGGAVGQPPSIYIQGANGKMNKKNVPDFSLDALSYDTDISIEDFNMDGNLDLVIASGGYHNFTPNAEQFQDRLYLGDGTGRFTKANAALPKKPQNTSTISAGDLNGDNYPDLFIGGGVVPGRYPETYPNYILINDGKGKFMTKEGSDIDSLYGLRMVSDAKIVDINDDKSLDLIVIGEWMPIKIYINNNGNLKDESSSFIDGRYNGFWNTIEVEDINEDGHLDILVGNLGNNTQFKIDEQHPATLVFDDFDNNGAVDPILNFYYGETSYPYVTRDELMGQLAYLRQKYTSYAAFSEAKLVDIFPEKVLSKAKKLEVHCTETSLFLNNGNGKFEKERLPIQAQFAPVFKFLIRDFDLNGTKDLLLLGNDDYFKLRIGKFDANYGTLILQDTLGGFRYVPQNVSGLDIRGSQVNGVILNENLFVQPYGKPTETYKISN